MYGLVTSLQNPIYRPCGYGRVCATKTDKPRATNEAQAANKDTVLPTHKADEKRA